MFNIDVLSPASSPRSAAERAHANQVKEWFRAGLGLDEDAVVTVNEVNCTDPRCPGFETIIAVLAEGQPTRSYKIFLPILEIYEARVDWAIRKGPEPVQAV